MQGRPERRLTPTGSDHRCERTATLAETFVLEAVSRTALAAFTGMTAGRQAFLSEVGRDGIFVWSAVDESSSVTADPLQGIHVPPDSDPTGASGAWVRIRPPGYVHVDWFGAAGDAVDSGGGIWAGTDDTPSITAAIAAATALKVEVWLGPRAYMIEKTTGGAILLLSGVTMRGCGQDISRVCKVPNTGGVQSDVTFNFVIQDGGGIYDLTIEGNKSGMGFQAFQRNFGVLARGTDTEVARVTCRNINGYALHINGQTYPAARNRFRDCLTINCQIHMEPTWVSHFLYENIAWQAGDDDMGPGQIGFEGFGTLSDGVVRGIRGEGPVIPFLLGLNHGSFDGLLLEDIDVSSTYETTGFRLGRTVGSDLCTDLKLLNVRFTLPGGSTSIGINADHLRQAQFVNCNFSTSGVAVVLGSNCDVVEAVGCIAETSNFWAVQIAAGATKCSWIGGRMNGPLGQYKGELRLAAYSTEPQTWPQLQTFANAGVTTNSSFPATLTVDVRSTTPAAPGTGAILGLSGEVGGGNKATFSSIMGAQLAGARGLLSLRVSNSAGTQTEVMRLEEPGLVVLGRLPADHADDAAAAAGGVPLKGLYRTGSVLKIRAA